MTKIGFFPDYSEANPYQRELAKSLEKKGNKVEIFDGKTPIYETAKEEDLDIINFHWLTPYIHGENFPETLYRTLSTVLSLLMVKRRGIKLVWTVHNVESHNQKNMAVEKLFKLFCTKFCFAKIINHCNSAKEKVRQKYRANEFQLEVIKHGNYINSYPNNIDKAGARAELGLEDKDTVFLYFGQIRRYKGILNLIGQFRELEDEDSKLVIAGNTMEKDLASEIKKNEVEDSRIIFHEGFVPDGKIQNYMNASDCVVLPYKEITTSGTVLLAMSFGKPVIAPKKGCIPEYLTKEGSILFESLEEIGESIQSYNKHKLAEGGDENLNKARKMDWDSIARKTDKLYREIK